MTPKYLLAAAALASILGASTAIAGTTIQYKADADPATEGFSAGQCYGYGATVGAIASDGGTPAWNINSGSSSDQYSYGVSVSAAQESALSSGFTETLIAQPLQQSAPSYSPGAPTSFAASAYSDGSVRWEMDLGLNSSDQIVVILPSTITNETPGGVIYSPGASYALPASDDLYNTFQLVESGGTADLYVNGTEVLSGYTGETSYVFSPALVFAAYSGGGANFNEVSVSNGVDVISSAPEPASWLLMIVGVGVVGCLLRRREEIFGLSRQVVVAA